MDEAVNHHFQETDTRTGNQTPHVLGVEKEEHMDTGRGISHIRACCGVWGLGEVQQWVRDLGRDNTGRNA